MKLYNTTKNLILEAAALQSVIDAIKKRKKTIILYDGDEPGGKGYRFIEPVCVGYSRAGNLVLRAWDYAGASHRGQLRINPLPSWRFFRLDKILSFRLTDEQFNEPRPGYNPRGDKSMIKVIINANFNTPV